MDPFVKDRLEDYLSGDLPDADLERFEAKLSEDPETAAEVARLTETSSLFEAIRVEPGEVELSGDFFAHVQQKIDAERDIPFWAVFSEAFVLKRMAFGALMWLFALGGLTLASDSTTARNTELADMILRDQPAVQAFQARMTSNLEQNREFMLSVVLAPEE